MKFFRQNKNKHKHIFIHIGLMKTGTSAIQTFLYSNDKFFKKNNFFIPSINKKAMNYLGFSLLDDTPPFVHHKMNINREELYDSLIEEINNCKQENIIITSEAYSLISTELFIGEQAPKMLYSLFKNQGYTFSIIIFVRRQDEYLESQYNQHIKTHNFWDLYSKDIMTFYNEKKELFNYNLIIDRWAKVFGEENIIIKVYNKQDNSVELFCKILKIKLNNVVFKKEDVNKKLGSKSLEFMRIANKFGIDKTTVLKNYTLVDLINEVLEIEDTPKTFLQKEDLVNVLNDFHNENISLSNKYLNGDVSWFLPKKSEKGQLNESIQILTVEECIHVATHIWNHFQKNNNK